MSYLVHTARYSFFPLDYCVHVGGKWNHKYVRLHVIQQHYIRNEQRCPISVTKKRTPVTGLRPTYSTLKPSSYDIARVRHGVFFRKLPSSTPLYNACHHKYLFVYSPLFSAVRAVRFFFLLNRRHSIPPYSSRHWHYLY